MRRVTRSRSPFHAILPLALAGLTALCAIAGAADAPGGIPLVTDPTAVFTEPATGRPGYLTPTTDPTFHTGLMRIAADPGVPTSPVPGSWGGDARHVYSKQQAWNSDMTLISIENRAGGSPSPLLLDGTTFRPVGTPCAAYPRFDYRWHPSPAHPHEQINVTSDGRELMWFDVIACVKTRSWTLPFAVDYGIGSGEGNPSRDGRFVALGDSTRVFVVDMDPQPPFAPWPAIRIGPVYTLAPCSLSVASPSLCPIGNLSISPSGRFIDIKYSGAVDTLADIHRIFEVDSNTLAIRPHLMADAALRCGSFSARPNGWIFPLKHADMALDPFDGDADVIVGGRSCPGSSLGHVVKVRLRDGAVTALTAPANEASVLHVSTRAIGRPGWAYVSYYDMPGYRFSDEIVAVKLDGSGAVERLAHQHNAIAGCYRCQPHPVPSPDGLRILFASNWALDCGGVCGDPTVDQDYLIDLRGMPDVIPPAGINDAR